MHWQPAALIFYVITSLNKIYLIYLYIRRDVAVQGSIEIKNLNLRIIAKSTA